MSPGGGANAGERACHPDAGFVDKNSQRTAHVCKIEWKLHLLSSIGIYPTVIQVSHLEGQLLGFLTGQHKWMNTHIQHTQTHVKQTQTHTNISKYAGKACANHYPLQNKMHKHSPLTPNPRYTT